MTPHWPGPPVNLRRVAVVAAGVIALLAAVVSLVVGPSQDWTANAWSVATFVVVMLIGGRVRLPLLDRQDAAPLASIGALAFGMGHWAAGGRELSIAGVLVVVGFSFAVIAFRRGPGDLRHISDTAARYLAICAGLALYRLPLPGAGSVFDAATQASDKAPIGMAMLGASLTVLVVETVLVATCRAADDGHTTAATLREELSQGFAAPLGLSTTGALIALAAPVLGLAALPFFIVPALLTLLATRRHDAIRRTYRETIEALAGLTDIAGFTRPGHAVRVAELTRGIGRELGRPPQEIVRYEYAALLHDLGQVALVEPIPGGATLLAAPFDQREIADDGARIVRDTGVLSDVADAIARQNVPYRQSREHGEALPLSARILKVANAFDDITEGAGSLPAQDRAMERIHLGLGYEYDPEVVEALGAVLQRRRPMMLRAEAAAERASTREGARPTGRTPSPKATPRNEAPGERG
ncbi:HD-GYP domain-containing protein [Janibacter sp. G56]|uniref:HD-GYP domain-containing protein n=1 Tax=Janibacter sp. G56 TaxID=3418717 RepID=UPI003CFD077E